MDEAVFDGLGSAIDRWIGLEAGSYGMGKRLADMWVEEKGVVAPFSPDGVRRLIGHIQEEEVFQDCERASQLQVGHFGAGGIETFGGLFDHLKPCGQ